MYLAQARRREEAKRIRADFSKNKNSNASCNLKTVNITEVINGTRKAKFFLEPKIRHEHESLILAQDERWRRA